MRALQKTTQSFKKSSNNIDKSVNQSVTFYRPLQSLNDNQDHYKLRWSANSRSMARTEKFFQLSESVDGWCWDGIIGHYPDLGRKRQRQRHITLV